MKKTKTFFVGGIILSLICLLVFMQLTHAFSVNAFYEVENKITVIGSSEVCVNPDTAVVTVGVETLNSSITTAQKNNSDTMNKIINTLTSNNVTKDNIRTKNYFIREKYDYSCGQEFMGYQVSNFIEFKTTDLENLNTLIATLTENGANAFNGINFTLSNFDSAYNEALSKAVENAQNKLKTLNLNNQKFVITGITEAYSYNSACNFANLDLLKVAQESSNIEQGKICIKAQVEVVFEKSTSVASNLNSDSNTNTNQQTVTSAPHTENNTINKIISKTNTNEISNESAKSIDNNNNKIDNEKNITNNNAVA